MKALAGIKTIKDFELSGKTLFLRLDLNVPIKNGHITDETRITESLPTLRHALAARAKIIVCSHLGRPKSKDDKSASLLPVGQRLSELLEVEVILAEDDSADFIRPTLAGLRKDQIILLENVRYHDGETKNSDELAKEWASYTDIYINDAFGASHRAHASIDALPKMVTQKGCGFLIEKELGMLGTLLESPKSPFLAIMGGAKVSDKIPVIENLIDRVDAIIIGGAMAYTFLKAQGVAVGKSLVETEQLNYARELLKRFEARNKSILLPVDHRVANAITDTVAEISPDCLVPDGKLALDIGPKTETLFNSAVKEAKTIFWNGPMGVFETPAFSEGTMSLAKTIAGNTSALRIVGGGDSASAANMAGIGSQVDHISTGGGASLEFIQGEALPGIEVLRNRKML